VGVAEGTAEGDSVVKLVGVAVGLAEAVAVGGLVGTTEAVWLLLLLLLFDIEVV
jgi:hypothetical protein